MDKLPENQRKAMQSANIDADLSLQILEILNQGMMGPQNSPNENDIFDIPTVDGKDIVDFSGTLSYRCPAARIQQLLEAHPELQTTSLSRYAKLSPGSEQQLGENEITELGLMLSPYFAFGVLNGGSASSYFDIKKNRGFSPELFELFEGPFSALKRDFSHLPKALCPAFLNKENRYGPSFIGLKIRSLLCNILRQKTMPKSTQNTEESQKQSKFFQMTSELTHNALTEYIAQGGYIKDPANISALVAELGWQPEEQIFSEKQPLISTFAPKPDNAQKWQFFRDKNGEYLAMPGGHGQCFFALRKRLQMLYDQGIRYVSLGNIDNIAYNPQPLFIGLLALSAREGLFICSYRSPVDIKGGVLLRPSKKEGKVGKLNCFDIGVGVDKQIFSLAQQQGKQLLFNCAIGYFDLSALLGQMEKIITKLPLRISEQNKDRGHYWQVEQVSWEVIGLLESVLIGAVRKENHFLAAKLQLETFLNTAYGLERYENRPELQKLAQIARSLSLGYARVLQRDCEYCFGTGGT